MMNAERFARSVQRRLGMKAHTHSVLYSFLLALRTVMRRDNGRWQETHARAQATAARARQEGWSTILFYDHVVTSWRLYLELAALLETVTPENVDERMTAVVVCGRAGVGVLGGDIQAALNVCHLFETGSGQYEDWRSKPVAVIQARFDPIKEASS